MGLTEKPTIVPVPDRGTDCGLPLALSVIASAAERFPEAVGVNVAFTVVLLPGVTVMGVALAVKAKSPAFVPVSARLEITKLPVPELLIVIAVGELALLTVWLPKLTGFGLMLMVGAVPVPDRGTVCGLPLALSLIVRLAVRLPVAAGAKVTIMV